MFLAKNPSDFHKSDEFSQWWLDWYEYTTFPDTGQIIYRDRVLFAPSQIPNRDKYIQQAIEINLGYPETISGPFNFEKYQLQTQQDQNSNYKIGNTAETFDFGKTSYHQPLDQRPHRILRNKRKTKTGK